MASRSGEASTSDHVSNTTITTVLLSNIHCPSCVKAIDSALEVYANDVVDISTSTVTQTVVARHHTRLSSATIAKALYDAGFDVQGLWEQREGDRKSTLSSWLAPTASNINAPSAISSAFQEFSCGLLPSPDNAALHTAKHTAYCRQCASEGHASIQRTDSKTRLTTPPDENWHEADLAKEAIVATDDGARADVYKLVMSVHGMTCSSCVGRVSEVLSLKPYVEEVNVNLLNETATLLIQDRGKVDELVEEVEDIGYEAAVESCAVIGNVSAQQKNASIPHTDARTVTIQIHGIYCEHCPQKIVKALNQIHSDITIDSTPTIRQHTMTISYVPRPPDFTIRQILHAVSTADPAFSAEMYTPPSLEDRARRVQAKHRMGIAIRLVISIAMAIPTFIFGVVFMNLLPSHSPLKTYWTQSGPRTIPLVQWPLLACATIVYFFAADVFHRRALKELYMMWRPRSNVPLFRRFYRFGSMDMLLSLGTTTAYAGSIVVLILSAIQSMDNVDMDTTTYFDAVVFLTMFLLMGRLLEAYGKMQTADAVSSLGNLRPKEASLLISSTKCEGQTIPAEQVKVEHLEIGDVLVIRQGSCSPCDGIVKWGSSSFDESTLTGESRPVTKNVDDEVFAGTVNMSNAIHLRITKPMGVSLLDQIIDTVREGQSKRAPIERVVDIVTGYFVPLIILIAVCDWLIWLSLGYAGSVPYVTVGLGSWTFWSLQFAIAVLVVACPCGIGLAAPTALFVGTGLAAKHGILVKGGGEAFQEGSKLDCVVFDKTGTITEGGSPVITDHCFLSDSSNAGHLLSMMQALEDNSNHPLARAIRQFSSKQGTFEHVKLLQCQEMAGRGMVGEFSNQRGDGEDVREQIFIGNEKLAEQHNAFISPEAVSSFHRWSCSGKTVVFVGHKLFDSPTWTLSLVLAAADPIRPEAGRVIAALQNKGIEVWLLSGDDARTAKAVATEVGIDEVKVIAGVLPEQKSEKIKYLQRSQHQQHHGSIQNKRAIIAMVGDGINDAPALTTADIGIAMGSGSDTAVSSAGFVLLNSNLENVLTLFDLSKAVMRRVKFNFVWAMAYNLIMLPIAAGILFPATSHGSHIRLDPVWASLAMALSSVSVITSSLLLKTSLPVVGVGSTT